MASDTMTATLWVITSLNNATPKHSGVEYSISPLISVHGTRDPAITQAIKTWGSELRLQLIDTTKIIVEKQYVDPDNPGTMRWVRVAAIEEVELD